MKSLSDTLPAVVIAEGAHHLDLRGSDPLDPPSVIAAVSEGGFFTGIFYSRVCLILGLVFLFYSARSKC
jgi:hypothetical protein